MKKLLFLSIIILFVACKKDDPIVLDVPVATAATDVTNQQFTANWNNVASATEYQLDVSISSAFTSVFTVGNLAGSTIITGLEANTEYFYRVRATVNGENPSPFSNVISVMSLPDAPVATDATNITSSGFTANWDAIADISEYLLYVSEDNFPADPPNNLPDYNGIIVTGNSHEVMGLESGTIYYYVLRAKNGTNESEYSNSIFLTTLN